MKIPVQNIYYLLCYAWDKLEEGRMVDVSGSDYDDLTNLLSKVLVNGCRHLFKRGLDRNYNELTDVYVGIKGKVEFKESLSKNLFRQGKAICKYDEFGYNMLQNQILKATLLRLGKCQQVEHPLREEIWDCYCRFHGVDDIGIQPALFSKVRIHRNNSFYDFLIKLCLLIAENTVLDEKGGSHIFKEFIGSEKAMAALFESFIRNFYRREQNRFLVRREDIGWDAQPLGASSMAYLPKMQTDVTLESPDRKIIVETKYYQNALNSRFEADKFNSANLYQLFSYLKNIEGKKEHPQNKGCEGILIYPTVQNSLDEKYLIGSHVVKVCTIDLSRGWRDIQQSLLSIIE